MRWAACLGVALVPALAVSGLVGACFGKTLLDAVPAYANDEVHNWLQIRAFAAAGFESGYHVIDERPAEAGFSPFGAHGPVYPILYGSLDAMTGRRARSAAVMHCAVLALALIYFLRSARLSPVRFLLVACLLASFAPLLLLLPTTMQEGLHFAIAAMLAARFRAMLQGAVGRSGLIATGGFVVAAGLLRPSWLLLLFPWLLCGAPLGSRSARGRLLAAASLAVGVLLAHRWLSAPYPVGGFFFFRVLSLEAGPAELWDYAATNLRRLLWRGTAVERVLRYEVLLGVLASVAGVRLGAGRESRIHLLNLGGILALVLSLYVVGNWGDYRVLGVHLFLSLLLLASAPGRLAGALVAAAVAIQLAHAPAFLDTFRSVRAPHFVSDDAPRAAFGRALQGGALAYRGGRDRWCNTLLVTAFPFHQGPLLALPAGLGVSAMFTPEGMRFPPRSGYVLFDPDAYDRQTWLGRRRGTFTVERPSPGRARVVFPGDGAMNLEQLARTPLGDLYRNLDAHCP